MTIFEKNMKVILRRYPAMARELQFSPDNCYQVIMQGYKRPPNLLYSNERDNVLFYDPHKPLEQISSYLKELQLERGIIIIMLGMGLGYQLKILLSAFEGFTPMKKVIVVERDIECMKRAFQVLDMSDVLDKNRVKIIAGSPEEDLYIHIWNAISPEFGGLKAIKFVPWPASIRIGGDYYLKVKEAVRDVSSSFIAERGNDPYDNLVAYENFFENLPFYLSSPGIHHVKGLFHDRPAVVVAAGPSLNKNVHLLRAINKRAVIISADAALKVIQSNGAMPHFVTTVERTPGTEKFFEGISGLERTVLAVASFTYPNTLLSYPGPFMFMHRIYNFYETLGIDQDSFEMGGTTAHCAFALARHMGCNPIIFIGQDLAYGNDGVTHARGCAFGERQSYALEAKRIKVPANMGGVVETCSLWLRLLREYERTLNTFSGLAINATEGGAKIRGTKVMTFQEAIDKFCQDEFYPMDIIERKVIPMRPSISIKEIYERVESLLPEIEKVLSEIKEILSKASPVLRSLERMDTNSISTELSSEILRASEEIKSRADEIMNSRLFKAVGEYFMSIWVPLILEWQVLSERFKDKTWAEAYRLQLAEEAFGAIGQLCLSLLDLFEKGKEKLNALLR